MADVPFQHPTTRAGSGWIRGVGWQLIATVAVAVTLGLTVMVLFYSERQRVNILTTNETAMRQVTESVIRNLRSVMLAGYADIADAFADNLKSVEGVADFRILRTNGNEAFRDNRTIDAVNRHRGDSEFLRRDQEQRIPVLAPDNPHLTQVLRHQKIVSYYEGEADDQQRLTFLAPIRFIKACDKCHDPQQQVRGVLKLTTSLKEVREDIRTTRRDALLILLLAVGLAVAVVVMLVRRNLMRPIADVSRAMAAVSQGQLDLRVPVIGRDELADVATSFNRMIVDLKLSYQDLNREQNKLATVILTAREGIVVTDPQGVIILTNPAVSRILDKDAERITAEGLDLLLDNPELMSLWRDQADHRQQQVKVVPYRDRMLDLALTTIYDERGQRLGSSVMIRDITHEHRLQTSLRRLSLTDGLTGLHNRRFLDQQLERELDRARSANDPLSVLMFDIDHFKQFNDQHGHELGDRVLRAVARTTVAAMREVDFSCRYGGEEFVVILPSTDRPGAAVLAERLRGAVAELTVEDKRVTISVGVAWCQGQGCPSAQVLLKRADQALYRAKASGRNRVMLADRAPG